ncbi:MAG TPA: hypothetical protein DGD08_18205 [Gemmatimonas aurantiaca]|uniref:SEC-C domain-containing protein n=3 Tax=Gemmatimonas aurantiaca TaxID=173480 RepID=C1AE39_GEMAT|nr:hypothetical protein GAU_3724 [Gemmatimonas aurantiaca T-27]HCT59138.1 hypothetical protein [Gemmatimonas aurantiaca]
MLTAMCGSCPATERWALDGTHTVSMKGRDRNKPCWCDSGLKYKKCHLERELQERPSIWNARKDVQGLQRFKTCLHPEAGPSACSGPIVRAHTVRRAADLSVIARKGHVYQTSADLGDLHLNKGRLLPKLVGINEASTFFGFCSKHDSATFAPLEATALVPTDEQALLLTYRPLCLELYAKERQLESLEIARQGDKGRSLEEQFGLQEYVLLMRLGMETSLRDLRRHKSRFDADLLARDFAEARYVAVELDVPPDLMCSGFVQPHYTFDGERIQDLSDLKTELQVMSFSLASTAKGGVAVFAWRSDSDAASSELVDSLLRLEVVDIPHALVRYATSEFENTYYRPDWWDGLQQTDKDALVDRLHHGVGPDIALNPSYLKDDGRRLVRWNVINVSQKRC